MRARTPDSTGFVDHNAIELAYEVFEPTLPDRAGDDAPTILLLPTWTIVHSRIWKMQVPFLAEHWRVVTYDGPGNGASDRPTDTAAYLHDNQVAGALAVMDATGVDKAVIVSLSRAGVWALELAGTHPERVAGAVLIGSSLFATPLPAERYESMDRFFDEVDDPQRWEKLNAHHWQRDFADFAAFFFAECFSEPHSTKPREDAEGWAAETTGDVMLAEISCGDAFMGTDLLSDWCRNIECPVLVIHGTDDRVAPMADSEWIVDRTGGTLVRLDGCGHIPLARDPVRVNLELAAFVESIAGPLAASTRGVAPQEASVRAWTRARNRPKRCLYVSSPIGLGHARRDVAIARELRRLHPDIEIDWLAQHPVTRVLDDAAERVHPASARLRSESAHIESECGEHDLHAFQALRRMDEIQCADFMVFLDVVRNGDYDLVVGDEAWEVDYFLHENPELKTFAYAWLTDFVGYLPMPEGGAHEATLTADYNAEMIEQIERYPRIRDKALFVGRPDDIVPDAFGPDLPAIRQWTEEHYDFCGYVTGFDPSALPERAALRDELGYDENAAVCLVTVGGSGVGTSLLERMVDAFGVAKATVPDLQMVMVTGPRIDPDSLPHADGLEMRAYVPELYRHLAASDLAIVQGGLTTCMELTATERPFVYLPLRRHFEQNFHVHHRLEQHRAGVRMDFGHADPDHLADVIADTIAAPVSYRSVETGGAARAAAAIAELV